MGKNRKVILTIAVFMALALMTCAVLLPVALTPLVNTDSFKTKVIQTVEDKLGLQVQLGRIELFLCPLPGFRARDLKLALNPYTTLSIKTAAVDLDLNRLFKLQVAPFTHNAFILKIDSVRKPKGSRSQPWVQSIQA